jgi:predicted RNase H-like HicB family nuclease
MRNALNQVRPDELTERTKEAIEGYLEAEGHRPREGVELVGFQFVEVSAE